MQRRNWVSDVEIVADQLIENYRSATLGVGGPGADPTRETVIEGDVEAINTMTSWIAKAEQHGGEWQEDDWFALVQVLAKRAAWPRHPVVHSEYWCRC
jgi:hypothetical protein